MDQVKTVKDITPLSGHMRTHPVSWFGAILTGIGLWLLNGGMDTTPSLVLWFGGILILVGATTILLKGYKSLIDLKNIAAGLVIPFSAGIGIAVTLLLAEHALLYLNFPYPLDDGEGFCLNQALRIAQHQPLYPAIDSPPYIVTNYPPVYPFILSIFSNPENISFFAGRLISVISTILIFFAAVGCVRSVTGDSRAGFIGGLLVMASPIIYFWTALLRVDLLATAFGLIAIWIAVRSRGLKILWALPFLIAAIFTRQSSIEALVAIVIGLYFSVKKNTNSDRPARNVILMAGGWIIGVAVILIVLQVWTDGEFWRHTVTYTRTRFFLDRILSNIEWVFPAHALVFLIALFALPRALSDDKRRIPGIFFIASFATALLSGKVGSDLNYFLNLVAASGILAGFFAYDTFKAARDLNVKSKLIIPAMLLIPAALVQSGLMEGFRNLSFSPLTQDHRAGELIVEILSNSDGPILSEDEGFCLLSGHEVIFNPFIMSELARENIWDETPFIEAIENREFDLIMLRFNVFSDIHDDRPGVGSYAGWDRFTPAMELAIAENYEYHSSIRNEVVTPTESYTEIRPIFMRRMWFIYSPIQGVPEPVQDETGEVNLLEGPPDSDNE